MKSNVKSKTLILLTIGLLFVLLPIMIVNHSFMPGKSNTSLGHSDETNLDNENLRISAVSGKIHIINNSGWVAFKSAGNCTGNGNYSEPYVIEDLVIDANNNGSGILIDNSDVYFRIENCTIYNSRGYPSAGIKLSNVINAQLIDNDCSSNDDGIELRYSSNNTISGNTANNNYWDGIYLYRSNNNTISGNTADNCYSGISLQSSLNNNISGNTAKNNNYGIELEYSDYNTISGNTASNNEWDGIDLQESDNNTISGNTANNNGIDGISLFWSSDNNTISGNTLIGNRRCYSETSDCEGNIFDNNDCENRIDLSILYLVIPLTIFFITIPLTMAGMIRYEKKKHSTFPKYGTASLIFDILGLVTLLLVEFSGVIWPNPGSGPNYFLSLIATPFTLVGLISGYVGYKSKRDTTRVLEILGALIGIVLFFISIYPILGLLAFMGFF